MKYVEQITSLLVALMLAIGIQSANAQADIDANRMNRDINIMENVLEEIFKTDLNAHKKSIRIRSDSYSSFAFGNPDGIRGTYLPGFGVIFNVPSRPRGMLAFAPHNGNGYSYHFRYGDEENGETVSEETVTDRIVEFLQDYGSTIGQLSDTDKVMVIYNAGAPRLDMVFQEIPGDKTTKKTLIPTISVAATKANLKAYRSGDISSKTFRDRLEISKTEANGKKQIDMKVMANIFETAFKETEGKAFRITGFVDYLKLDNFGAIFSFDARYSRSSWHDFEDMHRSLKVIRGKLADTRVEIEHEIKTENEEDETSDRQKNLEEKQTRNKKAELKAYEQFQEDLREYLVDYGRTLSSVRADQHILISITLSSRYEEIPERVDVQIKKSTLEDLDKGSLSREQALDQISIREY